MKLLEFKKMKITKCSGRPVLRRASIRAACDPVNSAHHDAAPAKAKPKSRLARCSTNLSMALCALMLIPFTARAQDQKVPSSDLTEVSLEDLMNTKVTSVSRKEQKMSKVAAAIYVITQEDIRRSGATNIPDLLRMVPGLDVAQIDGSTWAISSRGFNGQFANKLLVMIDGRTVYDPLHSGVYWDAQSLLLEDIDRIEVIRGPGGTIWGANAVNGVINIITKSAGETQGALITAGSGNQQAGFSSVRYGGKLGSQGNYRVFGQYFDQASMFDPSGLDLTDGWHQLHGGFRTDSKLSDHDDLTMEGDAYGGIEHEPEAAQLVSLSLPYPQTENDIGHDDGGDILGRWEHTFHGGSQTTLQAYFDRIVRRDNYQMQEYRDIFDIDFQHNLTLGRRHEIVWGVGYRYNTDRTTGTIDISYNPIQFSTSLFSTFVQDEIQLVSNRLWLTLGTKVEHNGYTGFEVEPNVRLAWTPNPRQTLWAAISRAARTPARADRGLSADLATFPLPGGELGVLDLLGSPNTGSENLLAYEAGYRWQPGKRLSLDLATFYNSYGNLQSTEPDTPFFESTPPPTHLVIPLRHANNMYGLTYGAEASVSWKVTKCWTLDSSYSLLKEAMHLTKTSHDTSIVVVEEGSSPRNQFQIHSKLNLPKRFEFDTSLYSVGRLDIEGVPSYTRLDTRISWRLGESIELSLNGQNLLDNHHLEFEATSQSVESTEVKRSVYGKITWRF